jgi:uncharacterized alkaline shock family protein YloU
MSIGFNSLGNIYIAHRAICTIAHQAAIQSYGVVGLAEKDFLDEIANVLVKDPTKGVSVFFDGNQLNVDLYVIVEYGTRITTVAASVANAVRFQIEKALGLPVSQVNVHIRGLRISNPD